MEQAMTIETFHLLLFTIPGFFAVWSYHKANGTKVESDFEYLIFSFFWGLILLGFLGWFLPQEKFNLFFKNIYSGTMILSLISIGLGNLFGGRLDKYFDKLLATTTNLFKKNN